MDAYSGKVPPLPVDVPGPSIAAVKQPMWYQVGHRERRPPVLSAILVSSPAVLSSLLVFPPAVLSSVLVFPAAFLSSCCETALKISIKSSESTSHSLKDVGISIKLVLLGEFRGRLFSLLRRDLFSCSSLRHLGLSPPSLFSPSLLSVGLVDQCPNVRQLLLVLKKSSLFFSRNCHCDFFRHFPF